jgi:hypothetical protein
VTTIRETAAEAVAGAKDGSTVLVATSWPNTPTYRSWTPPLAA